MMKTILHHTGTILIVSVVTVLVWLYAEDANIKEYNNQRVTIRFVAPQGDQLLITPEFSQVLVSFESSRRQYLLFQDRVASGDVEIKIPFDPDSPETDLDLRQQLESTILAELGISLTLIDPPFESVSVERIVETTFEVRIEDGDLDLAAATADPREVTLRLPESVARELSTAEKVVVADLSEMDISSITQGQDTVRTVDLRMPAIPDLHEDFDTQPSNIEAVITFRIDATTAKATLDRRVVQLNFPPSINNRYHVSIPDPNEQIINGIELEGTPEQIQKLIDNPNSLAVWATVRLSNDEADTAIRDNEGRVSLPVKIVIELEGVRLVSEPRLITVLVQPRESPADSP